MPAWCAIRLERDGTGVDLAQFSTREVVELGMLLVPERRRLLPLLSVEESLRLGTHWPGARGALKRNLDECYAIFQCWRTGDGSPRGA